MFSLVKLKARSYSLNFTLRFRLEILPVGWKWQLLCSTGFDTNTRIFREVGAQSRVTLEFSAGLVFIWEEYCREMQPMAGQVRLHGKAF